MKTAVTIRENLSRRAENFARKKKISVEELYEKAIEEYLENRERAKMIAKINEVCEKTDTSLDPFWKEMQSRVLSKDEW